MSAVVHIGDATATLDTLEPSSFDALLCDPPYGLSFMGKKWDHGVPSADMWRSALRVLKPGAPLLAFGGTRTYHRLACAIEDAGFEIRDCLAWMYGSAMPKSLNVSKAIDAAAGAERESVRPVALPARNGNGTNALGGAWQDAPMVTAPATPEAARWDGYGTSLKPAWEPCVLARKPLDGTVASNVQRWGCGALAIDASRIGCDEDLNGGTYSGERRNNGLTVDSVPGAMPLGRLANGCGRDFVQPAGRWPANVILDEAAGALLDAAAGDHPGMSGGGAHRADYGGPSRFFYCAKVSAVERELGCEALPGKSGAEVCDREPGSAGLGPRAGAGWSSAIRNNHPTLKPVALMRYLARLVLPPPGRVRRILVPFSGAGSEMIGALLAGWEEVVGVELSEEYATIARARLKVAIERPGLYDAEARATVTRADERQTELWR